MCGLYASLRFAPEPSRLDIIAHRGPDGHGWREWVTPAGPLAFGHRRLAIIDTHDHALQPMSDVTDRFTLIFNGEIYNYRELREELMAKGYVFATQSDSEVLLYAYAEWGEACLSRLRGMFAFVIYDRQEQSLFAARDRFGIKPLYMVLHAQGVAFASEIKQLLGLPGLSGRMNRARVRDFLISGISDHTDETLFDGIVQLRAGECIRVPCTSPDDLTWHVQRWYDLPQGHVSLSLQEAGERFRELLTDAVRLHLRADVPVGSCLSGGLDSSSLVVLMSRMLTGEGAHAVQTISACYPNKEVDERPFMEAVVEATDAQPYWVFPKAEDVFDHARKITWHQDEPFGSTSIVAQWCVFEEARAAGLTVMLDGQGADEPLAGYHWGFPYAFAGDIRRGHVIRALKSMHARRTQGASLADQLARTLLLLLPSGIGQRVRGHYQKHVRHDWLSPNISDGTVSSVDVMAEAQARLGLPPVTDIDSLCRTMTFASNLQMLLHWEDRNSMAHGIEARVPFLDHPLVEFALALGNDHKMVGVTTKAVLREGMKDILPPGVAKRQDKLGFATPEQAWFRGPLAPALREGVQVTLARYPDLFSRDGTMALTNDMLEGRRPVDFTLWRIVNLGIWGECFGIKI